MELDESCRRYDRAIRSGRSTTRWDGDVEDQVECYRQAMERSQCVEARVRTALFDLSVPRTEFRDYINFGLHVDRICRKYESKTRLNEVLHAVAQWTARGARRSVLVALCRMVFDVELH